MNTKANAAERLAPLRQPAVSGYYRIVAIDGEQQTAREHRARMLALSCTMRAFERQLERLDRTLAKADKR